jgi:hypothetical protein
VHRIKSDFKNSFHDFLCSSHSRTCPIFLEQLRSKADFRFVFCISLLFAIAQLIAAFYRIISAALCVLTPFKKSKRTCAISCW